MARYYRNCSRVMVSVRESSWSAESPRHHQRYWRYSGAYPPAGQQGILVRRSREQLEMEIDKFTIIRRVYAGYSTARR